MLRFRWMAVLLLFVTAAYSQTFRGSLTGVVTDPQGAVVSGVSVQLSDPATGSVVTQTTNAAGEFNFPELSVGKYSLNVTASGFTTAKLDNLDVQVSKVLNVPVKLTLGSESTVVDVMTNGVQTDTTTSSLVAVIDQKSTQEIPLNGRNFTQMVTLSAGVNLSKSVNGSRTSGINYQVDGADNNDPWSNAVASNQGGIAGIAGGLIPIEAIDSFSMQASAEADMGRNGGANSNMVLRSGTNSIHGSVFYFDRNELFAWASPVNLPGARIPEIRNHQGGFALGGPIWKDHTFLFLAGEIQIANANNNISDSVISDGWVNAAKTVLANHGLTPNQVSLNLYNGTGSSAPIFPLNTHSGPATTGNYLSTGRATYSSYNGVIKIDHHINDKHTVSLHAIETTGAQNADVGSHYTDYFETAPMHIHNYVANWNAIFKANLVNQLTFAGGSFLQVFNDANQNFFPASLGLNLGTTPGSQLFYGAPIFKIGSLDTTGATPPLGRQDVTGHVTDSLHWTLGKHSMKIGGEYRHANVNVAYFTNGRGTFSFDGTRGPWVTTSVVTPSNPTGATDCVDSTKGLNFTGSNCTTLTAVADYLAGQPTNASPASILRGNPQRVYLVSGFDGWFQDSWQVSPKLTFDYGFRFSQPGRVSDDRNSMYNFLPSTGFTGEPLFNKDWTDFAPRIGFAYSPRGNAATVIRASYGWFYDQPTVGQFVYNSIGNGGATGIYSNPAPQAANPVFQVSGNNVTFSPYSTDPVLPKTLAGATVGAFSINPNFKTAYLQNYHLDVQQQMTRNTLLQISYVGMQGRRQGMVYDINQRIAGKYPLIGSYSNLLAVNQVNSSGSSNYNSLQFSLRQANWHGITATAYYTWGRAMDYASSVTTPMNSYNLKADYGPSTFDIRNTFTGFAQYSLPQLGHFLPALTKGFQLNALYIFSGGTPINLLAGKDYSTTGENKDRPNYNPNFPIFAGRTKITTSSAINYQYFSALPSTALAGQATAFASAPCASTANCFKYGNMRRDAFYGPGFGDIDFSLFKQTAITEKIKTEFRWEVFNLWNQANFASPSGTITSSSFGVLTQTKNGSSAPGLGQGEPRNMQFALKVIF